MNQAFCTRISAGYEVSYNAGIYLNRPPRANYLAASEVSSSPTCNVVVVKKSRRSGADLITRNC